MPNVKISVPLAISLNAEHRVRCVQCIQARLAGSPGIRSARVLAPAPAQGGTGHYTIELEYDASELSTAQINDYLRHAGGCIAEARVPPAAAVATQAASLQMPGWFALGVRSPDVVLAVLAGVFLAGGWTAHLMEGPESVRLAMVIASYVCGAWFPAFELWHTISKFKLDIDLLMFAAAFGAASLGHYEEGAMLLFLFSLGGAGERLAMDRARKAIEALTALAPKTATLLLPDGKTREIHVEELRVGDKVLVRPGDHVPSDGRVETGGSSINQAPITGESTPVDKSPGDEVFAGTINGQGMLTVTVTKPASDTTLAKVIRMVQEAQASKSPTQIFTDRVERIYVPLVLVATTTLVLLPPLLQIVPRQEDGSIWKGWFYQAMAFLTAASPCALAIGTPAAVLSGIARAARGGVLVKGGVHLENLGRVRAVAFDKTGTLTRGKPEVTDLVAVADGMTDLQLLEITAAVERGSKHPIAESIVAEAEVRRCASNVASDVEQTPGFGIRGTVSGRRITVGKLAMFPASLEGREAIAVRIADLASQGRTTFVVADEQRVLGAIGLADRPRDGVAEMIADLHRLGIRRTIMLTGDNARTAAAVSKTIGIDEYLADLLPEDKRDKVAELDKRYGRVAMVGDGVNDAAALATATVGIAVGGATGAGSDVALETADIALLANDMGKLPEAIGVSRFARRIVIQNLVIALGVICIVAPLAGMGRTDIWVAVLLHEGSTVVVVLNSLRILAYRAPRGRAERQQDSAAQTVSRRL